MSQNWTEDIKQMMQAYEQDVPTVPAFPSDAVQQFRLELINEELSELYQAALREDLTAYLDGIIDLLVVVIGAGVAHGLPIEKGWEEVLRSNLSKIPTDGKLVKRKDGKILKPDTYSAPNLHEVLKDGNT